MKIYYENIVTNEVGVIEGPPTPQAMSVKVGDEFTIAGVRTAVPNTDRKWWQFWKPKFVLGPLQRYRVTDVRNG